VSTARTDADKIILAIEDSGPGIDPKKLDRIFDAFVKRSDQEIPPGEMGFNGQFALRKFQAAHVSVG
jgi:K+-sensing histidine kinase KdpD